MLGTALGIAAKGLVSFITLLVVAAFLYALWARELDLRQYGTTKYWLGRWFESWFPENPNLLKNGNFDRGPYGWGTGWIETMPGARDFARANRYVNLGGAEARWSFPAQGGRHNSAALTVDHRSPRQNHVFSTLSQQIEVKPYTQYEVRFWSKVNSIHPTGSLTVFCGVSDENSWELGKANVLQIHDWREYTFRFTSDDRVFVDVRLRTEGPIEAWVDDISVREIFLAGR